MDLETNETNENETSTANTVANFVVLGFAVIGAVQTTRFVIRKAAEVVTLIQLAKATTPDDKSE